MTPDTIPGAVLVPTWAILAAVGALAGAIAFLGRFFITRYVELATEAARASQANADAIRASNDTLETVAAKLNEVARAVQGCPHARDAD